jgi:23S rRNA (adenine2503-C2)-methyltransferase
MTHVADNSLLGLDRGELLSLFESIGEASYRAQQLLDAIYREREESIERISTLPQPLRSKLVNEGYSISLPVVEKRFMSKDGTVRYLVAFTDGQSVETVWMPEGDGGEAGDGTEAGDPSQNSSRSWDRATICVSSQVGCAVGCKFCMTALLGVKRNLTAGEIVSQVLRVLTDQNVSPPQDRVNLSLWGWRTFPELRQFHEGGAIARQEVGIPESRMTVSTAGIMPRIHDFGLSRFARKRPFR